MPILPFDATMRRDETRTTRRRARHSALLPPHRSTCIFFTFVPFVLALLRFRARMSWCGYCVRLGTLTFILSSSFVARCQLAPTMMMPTPLFHGLFLLSILDVHMAVSKFGPVCGLRPLFLVAIQWAPTMLRRSRAIISRKRVFGSVFVSNSSPKHFRVQSCNAPYLYRGSLPLHLLFSLSLS